MEIKIGNLFRIKGNILIRTDDGYLMGAYLFHPRDDFYNKDIIWDAKPFALNNDLVMVVDKPMYPNHDGVHVLYEDKICFVKTYNLIPL